MADLDPSIATRFQPGQSGNPAGRPKGQSLTARLRRYLDAPGKDGRPRADRLAETLAELALSGDIRAIRMVLDRLDGKALDRIKVDEPSEMTIRVVYEDLPAKDLDRAEPSETG
jgi:hypothetical protein